MGSQAASSLALPILKFSYVTTTTGRTSPLSWTHIAGGSDLKAVFERVQYQQNQNSLVEEKPVFKVLRGTDVLEDLDLGALAREAVKSSASQSQVANAKAAIAVIVKSPCLAIRYPTRVNQIRRFQVKFSSNADYCKALSILVGVGCPITESTVGGFPPPTAPQPVPGTSSWSHSTVAPSPGPENALHSGRKYPVPIAPAPIPETRPSTIGSSSTLGLPPSRSAPIVNNNTPFQSNLSQNRNERPFTVPKLPEAESISQLLPPRRELPFAKPRRRQCYTASDQENRTTTPISLDAINDLSQSIQANQPPMPCVRTQSVTAYGTSSSSQFQNHIGYSNIPETGILSTTSATPSSSPQKRSWDDMACLPVISPRPALTDISNIGQIGNSEPHPSTAHPFFSFQTPTNPIIHPPSPESRPNPNQHVSNLAAPSIPVFPPATTLNEASILAAEDFSAFLETPTSERSALVESWVCRQLESDGFLALCQDVEGVWRRIAFGL